VLTGERRAPEAAAELQKDLVNITGFRTGPPQRTKQNSELKMKSIDAKYFNLGPRLTLTFALLIALILGGNGSAYLAIPYSPGFKQMRLSSVSQQTIQFCASRKSSVISPEIGELAQSNAYVLRTGSDSLQTLCLSKFSKPGGLIHLPPGPGRPALSANSRRD